MHSIQLLNNTKCIAILASGMRKGQICDRKCKDTYCGYHKRYSKVKVQHFCPAILASGKRKGKICNRLCKHTTFACGYHINIIQTIQSLPSEKFHPTRTETKTIHQLPQSIIIEQPYQFDRSTQPTPIERSSQHEITQQLTNSKSSEHSFQSEMIQAPIHSDMMDHTCQFGANQPYPTPIEEKSNLDTFDVTHIDVTEDTVNDKRSKQKLHSQISDSGVENHIILKETDEKQLVSKVVDNNQLPVDKITTPNGTKQSKNSRRKQRRYNK